MYFQKIHTNTGPYLKVPISIELTHSSKFYILYKKNFRK